MSVYRTIGPLVIIIITIIVEKTKTLMSCPVTAHLICAFVFAYAKSRFSHVVAHLQLFD